MEGHPVVALNRAARVSERFRDGTEFGGHGTSRVFPLHAQSGTRRQPPCSRLARQDDADGGAA